MLRRIFALTAATLLLVATAPLPSVLAPYINGETFNPGDYGWMRGGFDGATLMQVDDWHAVQAWIAQCDADNLTAVRAAFAQRGTTLASSDKIGWGGGLCAQVHHAMAHGDQGKNWATFQTAVSRARPVADAIIWSAAIAQSIDGPRDDSEAEQLRSRPMTDQLLRTALAWNDGEIKGAPPLDPAARGMAEGLLWRAISQRDHDNTEWLRADVAKNGWPTISRVGEAASDDAWLLVQHADDDPVFQFDMLKLMTPAAMRGDVSKRNFALLSDRVTLKTTGKQRYGTQFTCGDGHHVPQPLEDESRVAEWRASMGLEPLAENAARIDAQYARCPPAVIPPSSPTR